MALQKTVTTRAGVTVPNAYIRVGRCEIVNKTLLGFSVDYFANESESFVFDAAPQFCEYDINGENPIKQAYVYLKTLPEFANAVDC